ncbi:hypothetical protein [Crateriforma conspicua]|uniref:Uncharacterized protein n=2 Tax=Crateriforma conspicua TaxID=2527996 RepID=A0A5C5Y4Y9_9PLAN|nr:hypothetical protein [Crateriforma conspicua]QDV62764.1 hypothetical protein Mal65_19000 [Crateriforma conspicua]TWT68472.1 hypothetical protein Pan14r_07170 [Crateriforma conspicua]
MPSIPMFSRHVGGDVMAGLGGGVNATESLDMIGLAIAPLMAGGLVRGHGDVIRGGLYRVDKTRFLGRPCAVLCIARC